MTVLAGRRPTVLTSAVGAPLVAGVSQALALLQLALLLLRQPPGPATDAYFLVFTWSLAPIQIALVGVAYPRWLRARRFGPRGSVVGLGAVAVGSAASAAVAGVLFGRLGGALEVLHALTALLALNSAVLSVGWALALRLAAHGRGLWLAAVTLPSNALACVALLVCPGGAGEQVLWMCTGLLAGSLLFSAAMWRCRALHERQVSLSAGGDGFAATGPARESGWFAAKSVGGYGAGLVLQTMTASLASPGLTYVNVLARLVSGFSTVVTNALLPRMVSVSSTSGGAAVRYCWAVTVAGVACGIAVALGAAVSGSQWAGLAAVGFAWVVATTVNATMQRVATRFASARLAAISIGASLLVTGAALTGGGLQKIDMAVMLTAFVCLDLLSGVAYAALLRRFAIGAVAFGGVAAIMALAWSTVSA